MENSNHRLLSDACNQRGIELADKGWLEEAINEFDRAIQLDTGSYFARINRASVFLEQGRKLEALEDLLAAVRLAPDESSTHYHLGTFQLFAYLFCHCTKIDFAATHHWQFL